MKPTMEGVVHIHTESGYRHGRAKENASEKVEIRD